MSLLEKALESGKFGVTAEMAPPKGYDFSHQLADAELLKGKVHGINVTDMQSACLKATSLGLCIHLKQAGCEPILQMTGRDRSRMVIMAEMLSAYSFGIDTMLSLTGDHPTVGDCRNSKPVYDLDSVGILRMLSTMELTGKDCGGNDLTETPKFYKGACVTPVYEPVFLQINKLKQKVDAGAKFMNQNVPGIDVPQHMIDRLAAAAEEGKAKGVKGLPMKMGMEMAAEMIAKIKDEKLCDGVHIMAFGAEKNVPTILDLAGLDITKE